MHFYQADPSLENYWRGVILFGNNVASYKFALAHALYDLHSQEKERITMDELAHPFSQHLCRHLEHAPKQITVRSSQFIDACSRFNRGEISEDDLLNVTVKRGFANVIDAFHNVNRAEIDVRFFVDERKSHKGIRLTDAFFKLTETQQFQNLIHETDARWRLVERAWEMGVSSHLLAVEYDDTQQRLFTRKNDRRVDITSCRNSLNGYQKGRCFYCFRPVSLASGDIDLTDVDHFIPWSARDYVGNINGVWNLVLACQNCNRGKEGKFAHVPSQLLLERLHKRNEYFINSHLPLRETLIKQTGKSDIARRSFLNTAWQSARNNKLFHIWHPQACGDELF